MEAILTQQTQVPIKLLDVSGMVLKLLLPGQEDISHLLLALPAAKEGADRTARTQPCDHTVLDGEGWHCIPGRLSHGCFTLGERPNPSVSQLPHQSNGDTISHGGIFTPPPAFPKATRWGRGSGATHQCDSLSSSSSRIDLLKSIKKQ